MKDAMTAAQGPALPGNSIGRILLDAGKITAADAEKVLAFKQRQGLRFGEAAVQLKLISESDLQFALATQFSYSYIKPGGAPFARELIAAYQPWSRQVEVLRGVRTQLLLRWFDAQHRALAVVSPRAGDGRSYVAANLAIVCSQLGERTLLIDADLRRSRLHTLFGLGNEKGLSSILAGRAGDDAIAAVTAMRGLSVLPAGPEPPNPQELLAGREFEQLLQLLAARYDVILLDTTETETAADALMVASRAGGVVVIGRKHYSRVAELNALAEKLAGAGAEVVGTVLNEF